MRENEPPSNQYNHMADVDSLHRETINMPIKDMPEKFKPLVNNIQENVYVFHILEGRIKGDLEKELLNTSIENLNLSVRALNGLRGAELKTVEDILNYGFAKLGHTRNIGRKTIGEIKTTILNLKDAPLWEAIEDQIKKTFVKDLLSAQVEELDLPIRALNVFRRMGLQSLEDILNYGLSHLKKASNLDKETIDVEDVINYGLSCLCKEKNMGRKTISIVKKTILELPSLYSEKEEIRSFSSIIEIIFSKISPRNLSIIKERYCYEQNKKKTLDEIGTERGVTRERIRQIIASELRKIKYNKPEEKHLHTLIENIEDLLLQYKGIVSINEIAKKEYFASGSRKQIRFTMHLIIDLYESRYRIIDKYFLTSLCDQEVREFQLKIQEAGLRNQFPIGEKLLIEKIISSVGPASEDYIYYYLLYKEQIIVSEGKVVSLGNLSIPERIKLLMKDIDRPLHFTEIAKLYVDRFGSIKSGRISGHHIHARMCYCKEFILVEPGTFVLREKFKFPLNIKEIVKTSKEILRSEKGISDTEYLISELKKRKIDVGSFNKYSLKSILLQYDDFVGFRKFEIGLSGLENTYERKDLFNLIYDILISERNPLHTKTIFKRMKKKRGFPRFTVDQKLGNDSRFIKTAPATYTVKENITNYNYKRKLISDFAEEWCKEKKRPVSTFLISEVLKERENTEDLYLGLVEHVLDTSPRFIRYTNGFYAIADTMVESRGHI